MKHLPLSVLLLFIIPAVVVAAGMEITPFRTTNQSPLIQIYGLPAESGSTITPPGHVIINLVQDIASNYAFDSKAGEQILLDGESYRWTVAARYGVAERFEVGIEVPYLLSGGGVFDSFIIDWHSFFNLPQAGRDSAAKDRLKYSYRRDDAQQLLMDRSGSGIGDISLFGGVQLYDSGSRSSHDSVALRTSVKLPSGESGRLRGSGSTDVSLSLCGSMNHFTGWGTVGGFASAGGMIMTKGNVIRDQQNSGVAFGTAGAGWGITEWISFKLQLNWHTPFYQGSSLDELSKPSLMLISGGALKLPGDYRLDIGVSEDITVFTSPDIALHLGLTKQF